MAQLNLSHTLTAGTPENINDVQDNFQDIVDHVNNALIGDDNLTSPNNSVSRTVHMVSSSVANGEAAGTYLLIPSSNPAALTLPSANCFRVPLWHPVSADLSVTGKTTQIRQRVDLAVNATAPAVNFTFGLYQVTGCAGGATALSFTLGTVVTGTTVLFTTPSASTTARGESTWVTLPSAGTYVLGVVLSGTTAANTTVAFTAAIETRHT